MLHSPGEYNCLFLDCLHSEQNSFKLRMQREREKTPKVNISFDFIEQIIFVFVFQFRSGADPFGVRVRSGSVRASVAARSGSFGVRSGSFRVHLGSIQDPFGIRPGSMFFSLETHRSKKKPQPRQGLEGGWAVNPSLPTAETGKTFGFWVL